MHSLHSGTFLDAWRASMHACADKQWVLMQQLLMSGLALSGSNTAGTSDPGSQCTSLLIVSQAATHLGGGIAPEFDDLQAQLTEGRRVWHALYAAIQMQ